MTLNQGNNHSSNEELVIRLNQAENSYKVFGFSHMIITGSVADTMDSSFRKCIDSMYRKTKVHSRRDGEAEEYRQLLCKLYLIYFERGLAAISLLEPKLAQVLKVNVEKPIQNTEDKLIQLKKMVAEKTKRAQSLIVLQNRLKTDTVLAEWVIFKVEPIVHTAEKDLAGIECISQNAIMRVLNGLHRMKNAFQSLENNL